VSRRIVLLGASNLNMGFPRLLRAFENGFEGPLEICAATGHGRSYGKWSRIFHRALPGIVDCGLWSALGNSNSQSTETLGLITDVGNDLLYGVDVPQIAEWVETCVTRLKGSGAEVVVTGLPLGSLERLSSWRFNAARALFFPKSRIRFAEIQHHSHALHGRLEELAKRHGATFVELPGQWYGLDPIHFRHMQRSEAWRNILSGWASFPPSTPTGMASPVMWSRLARMQPEVRHVFGRERQTGQPVMQRGRVNVSLY